MSSRDREEPSGQQPNESEAAPGPPPYDLAAVGRVAACVQIVSVDLVGAYFERSDDDPLPADRAGELTPTLRVGEVEWKLSDDGATLGCAVNFGATFDEEPEPYSLYVRFRLVYTIENGTGLDESDLRVFANWNAVFNAWPYWREYLSSTILRAQLPGFIAPVMGVPRSSS